MSSTSALSRSVTKKSSFPKLLELCYKKLISHKHRKFCVGKAPYYLLKPVLRHCTPDELRNLEEANPHLMDEDMELWRDHFVRDNSNPSKRIVDPDDEDWRQLYWVVQLDRSFTVLGWQKMTPLQKLRRNHEKNDYYRPVFKQESSTIRRGSDQIGLKNNLRHEPYPSVGAVASQRRVNAVIPNNNSYSSVNSRITNSAPSRRSYMDSNSRTGPIRSAHSSAIPENSRITKSTANSFVQSRKTVNTAPIAQTRKPSSNSSIYLNKASAPIPQNRRINDTAIRQTLSRSPTSVTKAAKTSSKLAASRTSIPVTKETKFKSGSTLGASRTSIPATTASTKVDAKKNTTKLSDKSHVIRTKSDVRQKLYSKTHYDIQNDKDATIKSSKHLKSKRIA
ncbi:31336_t:CDS:2 [Gigaspora margarita]|uniref:31336_t:CDS:1 n=1 Tax=Gigaspora margarita TaxID=4874 RepID=A0ABN7VRQ7_GIGMA|nr:31336_t:CDS:2 [Gigaspora margarita]